MLETNKIYLGDCYDLIKQIPDKSIDLIYTDIPYEFVGGGWSAKTEMGKRIKNNKDEYTFQQSKIDHLQKQADKYLAIMKQYPSDSLEYQKAHVNRGKYLTELETYDINKGIDYSILDEFVRVMKEINIFIWCSKMQIPILLNYFIDKECNFEILVWCKTNPTPKTNNVFLQDVEYCLFFRHKKIKRKLNNGYDLKSRYYISATNQSDKAKYKHPTIKPLELVKRHILHTTNENDIVLDTFIGSGATAKACQETNRQYIGFEIDEKYYKIAVDRLNNINARGEVSIF